MFARIRPVRVTVEASGETREATELRCLDILIRGLGELAQIDVGWALVDDAQSVVLEGSEVMPQQVYEAWSTDDSHVLEWLAVRLRVRILELVVPFVEEASASFPLPAVSGEEAPDPAVVIVQDDAASR